MCVIPQAHPQEVLYFLPADGAVVPEMTTEPLLRLELGLNQINIEKDKNVCLIKYVCLYGLIKRPQDSSYLNGRVC